MTLQEKIVNKINEGQEKDVKAYTFKDISPSLWSFWTEYFLINK